MSEIRGITVGVDGSAPAMAALDWAARYARIRNAPLEILTAVGWPAERPLYGGYRVAELKEAAHRDGRRVLAQAVDRVRAAMPDLPVSGRVSDEPAIRALLEAGTFADLLVIGCRGLDPAVGAMLGSVSTAVVVHAESSVVVVRGSVHPGPAAPVVVGVDGSPASEATLERAFEEADRWTAPLVVAHAWSDVSLLGVFGAGVVPSWIEVRDEAMAAVAQQIAGWRSKYPAVRVGTVVEREQPARMLQQLGHDAGLIVVGSHGRGGFAGMRLGSVARRLAHHADVPVLVVRDR